MADRFAILLATFNGEQFLEAQLQSLADQDAAHVDVYVSDDGSIDGTRAILDRWSGRWTKGRFVVSDGPGAGFVENFRTLIATAGDDADFVAFCDQDDVWDRDKLTVAAAHLGASGQDSPALYCGRTRIIDENNRPVGLSPHMRRPPDFRNALVQSIAGGNTMVLNRAAFAKARLASRRTTFVSHDWWCYLIVSGCGGTVIYDPEPRIAYRQHGGNMVGANIGWRARSQRIRLMLDSRYARWTSIHQEALSACRDLLDPEMIAIMDTFFAARKAGRWALFRALGRLSIYRQSVGGELTLYLAAALKKV